MIALQIWAGVLDLAPSVVERNRPARTFSIK